MKSAAVSAEKSHGAAEQQAAAQDAVGGTAGNVTRVLTACDTSEHQQPNDFIIPFRGFLAGSPFSPLRPVSILFLSLVLKKQHGKAECFKLNQSIIGSYIFFSLSQVTALLQLTGTLMSIVDRRRGKVMAEEEAEQAINGQTALYSLTLLCCSFDFDHQEALVPVLQQTVEIVTSALCSASPRWSVHSTPLPSHSCPGEKLRHRCIELRSAVCR